MWDLTMYGFRQPCATALLTVCLPLAWGIFPPSAAAQNAYFGYSNNRASTVAEGYARGLSDVIRSRADARAMDAQTATELQNTRAQYYQNRVLAAQTFVEQKRLQDEYQNEQRATDRYKLSAYLETKKLNPLGDSEFDESSGQINWPPILDQPQDESTRQLINDVFAKRAKQGSLSSQDYLQGTATIKKWRQELVAYKDLFPKPDLQEAARFLNRLDGTLKGDLR
ncbi:hypothetical protein NHH03_04955 [Stieleria sp. TO1_6]|uniref:hypothetical protein n=1 Tax=Stieleria tagensis TaxID=2956795 RepID=UPI00209B183A|nr:hypothetical protein [Stieleria tagensis]MCO8121077.1 hypothetical protein [Stieleria tagensis]